MEVKTKEVIDKLCYMYVPTQITILNKFIKYIQIHMLMPKVTFSACLQITVTIFSVYFPSKKFGKNVK